jgi:3-dehydroquinate synthase
MTSTLTVDLGDRSYPIVIGRALLDGKFDLTPYLRSADCLVVSNETVAPLYLERLLPNLEGANVSSVCLPDGESYKTLGTLQSILDELVDSGANRDTTLIALGGGVVGDMAGFAAACYLRGVAFLQVPTTLLAQVDSSVGGKTGVNHEKGKNLIGAFHQPSLVLIDTDTLQTLAPREFSAGLAEVIKYGAICDLAFFGWLEANMQSLMDQDPKALSYAIHRCCELKADVVAEDERESGRRAILNFGHTFGHAIENSQGYGNWLHGEAVAAGMVMAAELSGIEPAEQARLAKLIAAAGLPTAPPRIAAERWLGSMGMDKKVQNKQLRFVLLRALGDAHLSSDFDERRLQALLEATD